MWTLPTCRKGRSHPWGGWSTGPTLCITIMNGLLDLIVSLLRQFTPTIHRLCGQGKIAEPRVHSTSGCAKGFLVKRSRPHGGVPPGLEAFRARHPPKRGLMRCEPEVTGRLTSANALKLALPLRHLPGRDLSHTRSQPHSADCVSRRSGRIARVALPTLCSSIPVAYLRVAPSRPAALVAGDVRGVGAPRVSHYYPECCLRVFAEALRPGDYLLDDHRRTLGRANGIMRGIMTFR